MLCLVCLIVLCDANEVYTLGWNKKILVTLKETNYVSVRCSRDTEDFASQVFNTISHTTKFNNTTFMHLTSLLHSYLLGPHFSQQHSQYPHWHSSSSQTWTWVSTSSVEGNYSSPLTSL